MYAISTSFVIASPFLYICMYLRGLFVRLAYRWGCQTANNSRRRFSSVSRVKGMTRLNVANARPIGLSSPGHSSDMEIV